MLYRFGDMHLLFDDALGKDGKLLQNGTGENAQDVIEAFKYTFSKPGNHFSPQKYHDLDNFWLRPRIFIFVTDML